MTPAELARVETLIKRITLSPDRAGVRVVDHHIAHTGPQRRSVAIVAFGPTASQIALYRDDPTFEVWCINAGYYNPSSYDADRRLRADRWFEIHQMHAQPADDLLWMQLCPVPLYVADLKDAERYGAMPNAVEFPTAALEAHFGLGPWWACTFAYQIALAIAEGFTHIVLLGMDFGSPREWIVERPNVLWWSGYAAGRGITVTVPEGSTLMAHPFRYGIEYDAEKNWTAAVVQGLTGGWGYILSPEAEAQRAAMEQALADAIPPRAVTPRPRLKKVSQRESFLLTCE